MGCGSSKRGSGIVASPPREGAANPHYWDDEVTEADTYVLPPPDKNYRAKKVNAEPLRDDESGDTAKAIKGINVKVEDSKNHGNLLDARTSPKKLASPAPTLGEGAARWEDPSFTFEQAMVGLEAAGLSCAGFEFKRPSEFVKAPQLFVNGAIRFDVGQGSLGTCYFLGMLAAIAEKPELLGRVIPDDAYDLERGVFHCNFWRFGEWITIYVDDRLMVKGDVPVGARSTTNRSEMWVSLAEKAFAKMGGSYGTIWGGDPAQAFVALTGGVCERLTSSESEPSALLDRCMNAINSGGFLAASSYENSEGVNGLIGAHCYTVTGAASFPTNDSKTVRLFKVRNPWGTGAGEWTGAWADKSSEWNTVAEETRQALAAVNSADGEFWMSIRDFCKFYEYVYICNLTPDMDADGDTDGLTECATVIGEWSEGKCGGAEKKHLNPVFTFSVAAASDGGTVPLCVQFVQTVDECREHMRADLYEVLFQDDDQLVLNEITIDTTYMEITDFTYRYKLRGGKYAVIPHTYKPARGENFLLRLFSTQLLEPKQHADGVLFMSDLPDVDFQRGSQWTTIGELVPGTNFGGVVGKGECGLNPQLEMIIDEPAKLIISLMQQLKDENIAVGYIIYKMDTPHMLPLASDHLIKLHKQQSKSRVFVQHSEATKQWELVPGRYAVVIFTDKLDSNRCFALTVIASTSTQIIPFQMGR